MQRKLETGQALDVETIGTLAQGADLADSLLGQHVTDPAGAVYRLQYFKQDRDYCVGSTEAWIWSVGRRRRDGALFASTDGRFYQHDLFECLWLR